jgi:hypothetical protein
MRAKEEKGEYYCEGCYKLLKDALGREAASQDYSGVCIKEENK